MRDILGKVKEMMIKSQIKAEDDKLLYIIAIGGRLYTSEQYSLQYKSTLRKVFMSEVYLETRVCESVWVLFSNDYTSYSHRIVWPTFSCHYHLSPVAIGVDEQTSGK